MSSVKPDESMIELPGRNEIELKINYNTFKTKTHYWHPSKTAKGIPPLPP